MTSVYTTRLQQLQNQLTATQIVCLSKPANIQYYSGFMTLVPAEREAYLVVSATQVHLFHTSFSPYQTVATITPHSTANLDKVADQIQTIASSLTAPVDLLLEYDHLTVNEFQRLQKLASVNLSPLQPQKIWQQRMIKDTSEVTAAQAAAQLTKATWQHLQSLLTTGMTEQAIAWEIESYIKTHGGTLAFPTIVAVGAHAALPHHQPTNTLLTPETSVLFDFGAQVDGYCADMSRTIWFGHTPSPEFTQVETAVLKAYAAALAVCQTFVTTQPATDTPPAIPISAVDLAARQVLDTAGYANHFIHTTGHGLGLEIHEPPSVYKTTTTLLKPNLVFTIEPGVYLPDQLGYRYENTIWLTESAVVELTK